VDLRTAELLLQQAEDISAIRSKIATILTLQRKMTAAFDTFKTVFEYLLAERAMLKAKLEAALSNDAADAAKIAAAEEALAAAGAKVTELQAMADTDTAEDAALLELVQPIADEIAAAQPAPEEPAPEEVTPEPEV
jgi:septal ring factor EnvC (AmiA/AmiB activator)